MPIVACIMSRRITLLITNDKKYIGIINVSVWIRYGPKSIIKLNLVRLVNGAVTHMVAIQLIADAMICPQSNILIPYTGSFGYVKAIKGIVATSATIAAPSRMSSIYTTNRAFPREMI